jgi:N utilization substance protein A
LAARLAGWDIDILTPDEYNQGIERLTNCVKTVEGADDTVVDKLIALGIISLPDLNDVGVEPLINELKVDSNIAEKLVAAAAEEVKRLAAESKEKQAQEQLTQQTKATGNEQ